jgi:DNA (cytosine-5)-methyltransferase 1
MGYHRAGFDEIVGVDIKPQQRYPFTFVQGDALEYAAAHGAEYAAIHASPPCQGYSIMNNLPWLRGREYPLLILPTRELLESLGLPFVIENVGGARYGAKGLAARGIEDHGMKAGWLCGAMFGLPFYRHRYFETNVTWMQPGHPKHRGVILAGNLLGNRERATQYKMHEARRIEPSNSPSVHILDGPLAAGSRGGRWWLRRCCGC